MWISLSDSSYVTTPVEKWLISSADMQKWFKWSWGHFALHCLCLSGYICMCVCVTVCAVCHSGGCYCCHCVADGSDVSLAWVTQHIYHSSAARVMMNTFPPLVLNAQTDRRCISVSVWYSMYAHLHTCTNWIHGAITAATARFRLFLSSTSFFLIKLTWGH